MPKSKRMLIGWIVSIGTLLTGLELLSIFSPGGDFGPYLHYLDYMSLANTLVPLPTNPLIIYMGREFQPSAVALLGAIGTSIANMTEYLFLDLLLAQDRLRRVKETAIYRRTKRAFEVAPFILMVAVNLVPLPIDPVRWMAISVTYPRWRYVLATFLGRLPRYYLLAELGDRYQLSNRVILIILAATVVPVLVRKILSRARK